ncbi:quinone oxidoreductase family protein [Actinoalloteichus spitiensis]|uniref:quinone oxidoreductase family protein n=1 Tax=Actinoalloteichus spitiensis TaxID=252394 RepID=UPI000474B033|nr:zinc-binding alcohol dehydrogenase family protein [Actinoalloteichus spitiensis]
MRAAIYRAPGGPEVLRVETVPDPEPAEDEVLVRVEAISIEGGDLQARRAVDPGSPPRVVGYAAAGEIVALGTAVTSFSVGQRVVTFGFEGSHASLRAAPAATTWAVPDGVGSTTAAAAFIGLGTAALAVSQAAIQPGEAVLVQGATGGVGVGLVQLAHRAGARVLGTGSDPAALDALRPHGLTDAVVPRPHAIADQVRAVLDHGAHVLIDTVGGDALLAGLGAVEDGGRVVLVGGRSGGSAAIDTLQILARRLTLIGCFLGGVMAEPATRTLLDTMLRDVATGTLSAPVDRVYPLSEAAAAHARAEERGRLGRVIMVP